jgi:lipopolysaccharide export system protein LptC
MTALRAIQAIGDANRIDLEEIDARLPLSDGGYIEVAAASGAFDRAANTLDISSEMTVRMPNGVTAWFRSARVDIATGELITGDPVRIELDGSRIDADSLQVTERGAVMIFENRVRVEIDASRVRAASSNNGEGDGE